MSHRNYYLNTYEFYDLDFNNRVYYDTDFYKQLIVGKYSEILELCCGTGRITIPLALEGISITALDISQSMLKILNNKISKSKIFKKITVIKSNMADFTLNKRYNCVLIPLHSFQNLVRESEISCCLKSIHSHLTEEGVFIFNIFLPLYNMKDIEGSIETYTLKDINGKDVCIKESKNDFVDTEKQIVDFRITYTLLNFNNKVLVDNFRIKYYYEEEIRQLLAKNNFIIEKQYYGFEGSESNFISNRELTIICKKV